MKIKIHSKLSGSTVGVTRSATRFAATYVATPPPLVKVGKTQNKHTHRQKQKRTKWPNN